MAKRRIMRVKRTRSGQWELTNADFTSGVYRTQERAIKIGRYAGRLMLKEGTLAQLVVHGRNGRIRFEHTYGRDPRRHKG